MKVTLTGQQIILLLAKYGPLEYESLKKFDKRKVEVSVKSNADGHFYATFKTVKEEKNDK